jgi:hypothetical protein
MNRRIPKFKVWDPIRKELAEVAEIDYVNSVVKAKFNEGLQTANTGWILVQDTELKDTKQRPIYEEDVVNFMADVGWRGWIPVRGRVVWNPHLSYGTYGFVIIDQDGSIHSFGNLDHIEVVGNTFLGVTK